MGMNKTAVLAALKRGDTVCHTSSRWHVGARIKDGTVSEVYKFDVFSGNTALVTDFGPCFINVGGVGSDG